MEARTEPTGMPVALQGKETPVTHDVTVTHWTLVPGVASLR
jgi:hypothetical protein